MKKQLICVLLLSVSFKSSAADFTELAERTIQLRREVDALGVGVDAELTRQRVEWEGLLSRKAEADAQLRKERLRSAQLKEKMTAINGRLRVEKKADPRGSEVLQAWIGDLRARIGNSLPFRRQEHLAELGALQTRLEAGESSSSVLPELWLMTQRYLRMGRENAFEVSTVEVDGVGARKAEIARLGLIQMAFRTSDGQIGFAKHENGKWVLKAAEGRDRRAAAERLLAKFRDKSATGYFEVPFADSARGE